LNILIRCDSSSSIGTGHVMRCLVLAKQYTDASIVFAAQDLDKNINHKIVEAGYRVKLLKTNDLSEVVKLVTKLDIDLAIIDSYDIDYKYEKKLKEKTGVKILALDDTYEKHYCDILLNHNIYAKKKKYKNLVPKECEIRCGAKYTLLRDEFIKEKSRLKRKKQFKIQNSKVKIFLAMGGADTANINIDILKTLKNFNNIKVHLVTTDANKNLDRLKKYSKNRPWINLHINSNKIAKLIAKSDFAIVTPSVTVNEVYYLGLPMIAIKTAKNQRDMYKYLKKKKNLVLQKFNKNKLRKMVKKFGIVSHTIQDKIYE